MKSILIAAVAVFAAIAQAKQGPEKSHPDLTGVFGTDVKTIGIGAISSLMPAAKLAHITNRLVKAGYRVKVAQNVTETTKAAPERRAKLLEELWLDPEVDIVTFATGGKGAEEVIELLDWEKLKTRERRGSIAPFARVEPEEFFRLLPFAPTGAQRRGAEEVIELLDWEKLKTRDMKVVGFSDLTLLVNMMLFKGAGHPYTGPVLTTLSYSNEKAVKRMRDMMAGRPGKVKLTPVKAGGSAVSGLAMGGLLDRLDQLTKRKLLPDASGRVVFIENTNKYAPRTDEMLGNLRAAGVFDKAAAVVFCDFNSKVPPEETKAKMAKFAAEVPCPVFAGYPYGHISNTSIIDFRRKLTISPDGVLFWAQDK